MSTALTVAETEKVPVVVVCTDTDLCTCDVDCQGKLNNRYLHTLHEML